MADAASSASGGGGACVQTPRRLWISRRCGRRCVGAPCSELFRVPRCHADTGV